jgi:hypothetical protein
MVRGVAESKMRATTNTWNGLRIAGEEQTYAQSILCSRSLHTGP